MRSRERATGCQKGPIAGIASMICVLITGDSHLEPLHADGPSIQARRVET